MFLRISLHIPADDYLDPAASKTGNLNKGHASTCKPTRQKGNVHPGINWKISVNIKEATHVLKHFKGF